MSASLSLKKKKEKKEKERKESKTQALARGHMLRALGMRRTEMVMSGRSPHVQHLRGAFFSRALHSDTVKLLACPAVFVTILGLS